MHTSTSRPVTRGGFAADPSGVGATIRGWFDQYTDWASDKLIDAPARNAENEAENQRVQAMVQRAQARADSPDPRVRTTATDEVKQYRASGESLASGQRQSAMGPLGATQKVITTTRQTLADLNPTSWVVNHKGLIITLAVIAGVVTILWVSRPALVIAAGAYRRRRY